MGRRPQGASCQKHVSTALMLEFDEVELPLEAPELSLLLAAAPLDPRLAPEMLCPQSQALQVPSALQDCPPTQAPGPVHSWVSPVVQALVPPPLEQP